MIEKVLVINTGSTSTKVALYSEYEEIAEANIQHTVEEVSQFISISEQKHFRKKHITQFLKTIQQI